MGILDDAIREHLELKRRHGAQGADLERLENEAFGPATRPGDPEFSEGREAASERMDAGAEAGGPADWPGDEDPTTVAPFPAAASGAAPTASDEPGGEREQVEQHSGAHPLGSEDEPDDSPVSRQLGPADEAEPDPAAEPPSAEPPEAPERGIFDADDIDFSDLDLDFGTEDEALPPDPVAEPASRPAGDATSPPTTDHDLPPAPVPPAGPGAAPREEGEASDEDLLEETPDFLQDAPEGEDLWFEQGPPRDFDFDDD